jgi:hypothetical protein
MAMKYIAYAAYDLSHCSAFRYCLEIAPESRIYDLFREMARGNMDGIPDRFYEWLFLRFSRSISALPLMGIEGGNKIRVSRSGSFGGKFLGLGGVCGRQGIEDGLMRLWSCVFEVISLPDREGGLQMENGTNWWLFCES